MKLRVMGNQSLEEFILRNIFKEFDTNKNGTLSIEEISAML
jgi:Ca2+-binding EF-hand superfamily protein